MHLHSSSIFPKGDLCFLIMDYIKKPHIICSNTLELVSLFDRNAAVSAKFGAAVK